MSDSAQSKTKIKVLVTSVGSYLGASLAKSLLGANCEVFGIGNSHLVKDLLSRQNFTLLELDLTQPLPSYLPRFDLIFYLDLLEAISYKSLSPVPDLTPVSSHIISQAKAGKSKVFVFVPITQVDLYEYFAQDDLTKKFLKMFLVGDLYGPGIPLPPTATQGQTLIQNELSNLISQAVTSDKVILENEGLKEIYPVYITDIIFAINKFVFGQDSQDSKNIHFLLSEGPQTSLSVAYEIQNTARLVFGKELGLFFTGIGNFASTREPVVRIHDLGFTPQIKLAEGLKNTFEYLARLGLVKATYQPPPPGQVLTTPKLPTTNYKLSTTRKPITSKIPHFSFKLRLKTTLSLVGILLLLTIAKTALDIYLGFSNLKNGGNSLLVGDFTKAKTYTQRSAKSFKAANNKTGILLSPVSFIAPQFTKSISLPLSGAQVAADATLYFIDGSEVLVRDLAALTSKTTSEGLDLETPAANFKRAYLKSAQASQMLVGAKYFDSQVEKAQKLLDSLNNFSAQAFEFVNLASDLTAVGGQKTYLILLQNNTELRPGGGFIGSFGLIEFAGGRLQNVTVDDIYTIDGQLQEKIEPPRQLREKLGLTQLYLRDSNWSPDFALNAATVRDLFKKETAKNVDGVIAVDLTLIQNLLSKIGPISLADYNEQITSDNLFERGEYYSEIGFFPGSTQKRDFFATLTRSLITKILTGFADLSSGDSKSQKLAILALVDTLKQGLESKHLLVTFDNPNLSSYVHTHGWDNPLPPASFNPADDAYQTRDFLAISEANLGANKVNRFLDRQVSYEATIGRDADLVATLTITYTNNSQAETWPAGKYVNYLRVYVPFAAGLEDFKLKIPPALEAESTNKANQKPNDNIVDKNDVEVTFQDNLTVFSTYVEVPVKSTQEVTFKYRIPKNIKLETAPTYSLYVQKQPGTEADPLTLTFNLPAYLSVGKLTSPICYSERSEESKCQDYSGLQNITLQTDLTTDRQFEIEVVKK